MSGDHVSPLDDGATETPATQERVFSLRARLLGLLALVLLPWLGLVLYTQADERKAAIAGINRDALRLIAIATSNQSAQIEAARQLLTAFAQLPQLRTQDSAACDAALAEMLSAYPLYLNFGVAEPDGNLRCSAVPLRTQINIADRPYFRGALESGRFTIGDYQIGRITRQPGINYAYPIVDRAGKVQAVVFAAQSLSWLTAALENLEFPPGAVLIVTDRNGTVLARIPDENTSIGQPMPEQAVFATIAQQRLGGVFETDDARGVRRLWAHAPLIAGQDLHATIGVPQSVAFADIDRRLSRNLAGLSLVTIAALAAAWFGSEFFILRQVDALVAATGRLASGELGARTRVLGGRGGELEHLARAFNTMAETLEARDRDLRIAEERTRAAEIELAVSRAQMDIAREIQRSLLPEDPLTLAGVRFAGRCIPAVAVGGDYFGYFPRGLNGVDSFISDVSGHGVGAALLMAAARTTFLAERLIEPSAAPILAKLNNLLFEDLGRAQLFMTACCATFDARTRELSYANAGHPPALLLRSDEDGVRSLQADGMLLGIQKDVVFTEVKVKLNAGDIVVFYTDGITERMSETGEFFGVDRLGQATIAHRADDPETLIDAVLEEVGRFAGTRPHDDDVTIVAMKVAA
jgi:serine phosphatase RsbU (regulator of sigma subunit)